MLRGSTAWRLDFRTLGSEFSLCCIQKQKSNDVMLANVIRHTSAPVVFSNTALGAFFADLAWLLFA